jgi:hypothetical protein
MTLFSNLKELECYPKEICHRLRESFGLYWMDSSSCANKIRSVLEILMDSMGINKPAIRTN